MCFCTCHIHVQGAGGSVCCSITMQRTIDDTFVEMTHISARHRGNWSKWWKSPLHQHCFNTSSGVTVGVMSPLEQRWLQLARQTFGDATKEYGAILNGFISVHKGPDPKCYLSSSPHRCCLTYCVPPALHFLLKIPATTSACISNVARLPPTLFYQKTNFCFGSAVPPSVTGIRRGSRVNLSISLPW